MWRTVIWKSVPRGARTGEEGAVDVDAAKAWVRGEQGARGRGTATSSGIRVMRRVPIYIRLEVARPYPGGGAEIEVLYVRARRWVRVVQSGARERESGCVATAQGSPGGKMCSGWMWFVAAKQLSGHAVTSHE